MSATAFFRSTPFRKHQNFRNIAKGVNLLRRFAAKKDGLRRLFEYHAY